MLKLQINSDKGFKMNIEKIKVVCEKCKTEIIFKLGKNIEICPVCSSRFFAFDDDTLQDLSDILLRLKANKTASFYLLGDDER